MSSAPGSIFASGLVFQNRYRLDEPVALGGMAEVWRGRDLVLQRAVAIKLLHPHLAAEATVVERFRREAIAAARLSHPNIVPTFDTGVDHGATYIVLGLVDGPSLAAVMRERRLEPIEVASLGRQIADALDHAHQNGVVHRDVKPANVLLVDNEKRVMVADFGIAKAMSEAVDTSLTLPGIVLGTPSYVAPEQLSGDEPGPRTDIYALGVLLHETICKHNTIDLPTQVNVESPNGATEPCPDLAAPLNSVIATATQRDPDNRYASAALMRDALSDCEKEIRSTLPATEPDDHQEVRQGTIDLTDDKPVRLHATPAPTSTEPVTAAHHVDHSSLERSVAPGPVRGQKNAKRQAFSS